MTTNSVLHRRPQTVAPPVGEWVGAGGGRSTKFLRSLPCHPVRMVPFTVSETVTGICPTLSCKSLECTCRLLEGMETFQRGPEPLHLQHLELFLCRAMHKVVMTYQGSAGVSATRCTWTNVSCYTIMHAPSTLHGSCLLYTSDAADE